MSMRRSETMLSLKVGGGDCVTRGGAEGSGKSSRAVGSRQHATPWCGFS